MGFPITPHGSLFPIHKKTIYFIRHAQSEANLRDLLASRQDVPLTEQGKAVLFDTDFTIGATAKNPIRNRLPESGLGGSANSDSWVQILSDIIGKPIDIPDAAELPPLDIAIAAASVSVRKSFAIEKAYWQHIIYATLT